jgi:choline dehydrogenase-like flavoprotein
LLFKLGIEFGAHQHHDARNPNPSHEANNGTQRAIGFVVTAIEWVTVQTSSVAWGLALVDEMAKYNHQVGLKVVGEMLPDERSTVTLADKLDQYRLRVARVTYSWGDNDKALIQHALGQMRASLEVVGAQDVFRQENNTNHLAGTARMGSDPRSSVVDADCRSWDIPNLWVSDGSVFPTTGGCEPVSDHHRNRDENSRPDQSDGLPR